MKYVSVELTGKRLSMLLCDTSARTIGVVYTVALPKSARGNAFVSPEQTAGFVSAKLREKRLKRYPVAVMLDSDQVISSVFSHYPTPPQKMRRLAELYSESSLPTASDYYIAYNMRGYVHTDGQNRSSLYAASAEHVKQLYQAFRKAGVDVYAIEASGAAFSRLALRYSRQADLSETGADIYVDFGESSSLVTVCKGGQLVFEQTFSTVYQDIVDTYTEITDGAAEDAAEFIAGSGLNPDAQINEQYPDLLRRMTALVDVALDEIFRTLRLAFSGERLEANRLFISGDFTAMPGFVERVIQNSSGFVYEENAEVRKISRLSGAEDTKREYSENLLYAYYKRKKRTASTSFVACILILLIATIFPIQYVFYNMNKDTYDGLYAQLNSPKYEEIRSMLGEKTSLESLKAQLERAMAKIPLQNPSKAGEIIDILYSEFKIYAKSVYIYLNNQTGALEIDFVTDGLASYLDLKSALEDTGLFTAAIPFSCSFNSETGACTGRISMSIDAFAAFTPEAPIAGSNSGG